MDYVDCTPNFYLDSTTPKLTIAASSLESGELRSPKFYLDCTPNLTIEASSLESGELRTTRLQTTTIELSGTPSKPRIVAGIEATRQKNYYGKPDHFNYASSLVNEVPGPSSNIAVIEAKRQKSYGGQQDDSPPIDNASLLDDTTTNPFNSFQPISWPISKTSFVGYRRRTNYTNEYLIAKVENIVDFLTQYELKLLKRTQYQNYRIYYTWDE